MTTTNFVWDYVNDCYLAEVDNSGNATAVYTNEPVRYGSVISQNRGGTTSYNHYDAQGSTRQLTDQNAQVTDEYTYTAFGESVASSGATSNPFRYVGEYGYYTDSETNDIYVRARTYKPSLARWSSRDPIGFEGSRWNTYHYVRSAPLNYADPLGLLDPGTFACTVAGAAGSAGAGATAGGVGGGVLVTVGVGALPGIAVGTGFYYFPSIGTRHWVQPRLTKLFYDWWPVDEDPLPREPWCLCECSSPNNNPQPFDTPIDTSKPFPYPRLGCYNIGCTCGGEMPPAG